MNKNQHPESKQTRRQVAVLVDQDGQLAPSEAQELQEILRNQLKESRFSLRGARVDFFSLPSDCNIAI